jgi:LacI family transcriptional regulator
MPKPVARSTMIDVARMAGVSLKTVSRVLNDEVYVRKETRQLVVKAANELNYQFNQAARTLRAGSAQIVALLGDNPSRSYLDNVHIGALKQCHRLGMQLVFDECEQGIDDIRKILDTLSPVGVVVTPPLCDIPEVTILLEERRIPYVMVTPGDPEKAALSVNMDDEGAAREMTQYLLSLGHKRIGFIKGHPEHGASEKRFHGYVSAIESAGIPISKDLLRQGYFDWASGLECAESLLDMEDRPTAVFACNDDMAASVLTAAYRRNIHVPRNLSVVGFDNTPIASIISPQLTTVNQPISDLASEAVNMLADWLSPMRQNRKAMMLEHSIIKRESVDKPEQQD